jgi:hypothetical protein
MTYDDGGIVHMTTIEISKSDAEKAQISSQDAYRVIIKYQKMGKSKM